MSRDTRDFGRELYPFLYEDEGVPDESRLEAIIAEVRQSTRDKARAVIELRAEILESHEADLAQAARAMADAFARGATLLAFGNGGSATDATDAVADCLDPPFPSWRKLPALTLASDGAILSAIANDVGMENVFVRQIIAYGRKGDIALAFSTSGNSPNVVAGLEQARRQGLMTVALSGYDGGRIVESGVVDFSFIARSDHIPRIQEGHATVWHALLEATQSVLGPESPVAGGTGPN